jgi:hypothetical protein
MLELRYSIIYEKGPHDNQGSTVYKLSELTLLTRDDAKGSIKKGVVKARLLYTLTHKDRSYKAPQNNGL